jgi:hypothetical protein
MIKQITKIKKMLPAILLLLSCFLLYTGSVSASAGAPLQPGCIVVGKDLPAGSGCNDIATVCVSPSSSLAQFCSDVNSACDNLQTTPGVVESACASETLSAACLNSSYSSVLGYSCLDLAGVCSSSPSSSSVCEGYTQACASSSASTDSACASAGGSSSQSTYGCYDSYTGWTYICGAGASSTPVANTNTYSVAPVLNASLKPDPTIAINGVTEYKFDSSDCYAVQLATVPTSDGGSTTGLAWVAQSSSDCSSNTAFATSTADSDGDLPMPDIATASTGTQDTCQKTNCIVSSYINPLIRFLNILVTLAAVIAIVLGGIQYSSARDNPEALKSARKHITNALLGLICYFLLYAFLTFIIPGGI